MPYILFHFFTLKIKQDSLRKSISLDTESSIFFFEFFEPSSNFSQHHSTGYKLYEDSHIGIICTLWKRNPFPKLTDYLKIEC